MSAVDERSDRTSLIQILLISIICFSCPGMFNALSGLGGGGKSSNTAIENSNTALAITFTLSSLLSVPLINTIGYKLIIPAALTYALFVFSFTLESDLFTVSAGSILGIGAGFLWNIQASVMISTPKEEEKGRFFSLFWVIFNLGALLGSVIPLAIEWSSNSTAQVSTTTYYGFVAVMSGGAFLGFLLKEAPSTPTTTSNLKGELVEILRVFLDPKMLLLIPLMAGSNWFYTYQFNIFNNGGFFLLRARSLNNSLYWLCQILGALFIGALLDSTRLGDRKQRALIANTIIILFSSLWICCIFFQLQFTRESGSLLKSNPALQMDIVDPHYWMYASLYGLFGASDSMYQGFIYWLLGSMTNDSKKSARLGGFYKTVQNAAAAVSSQLDARGTLYMTQLVICFGLTSIGLLLSYPISLYIPSKTVGEDPEGDQAGASEILGDGRQVKARR